MDPVTLAAAAVGLLAPFLRSIGDTVAGEASETLSDAAVPVVKRLFKALKDRLLPGSYSGNQLDGVE
ncbi:MAG TPA: hypothetical protein VGO78_10165, partial [Acidimicrobiales bacterium]|nr:hypothetical protein [Acidimicrobiales bacterium]